MRARTRAHDRTDANGGDPAGERVADVDCRGNVHPTQFWQGYALGNVRDRPFGAIREDETNLLYRLRGREDRLTGRCARCQYLVLCRGGSRLRALAVHGDVDGPDPQCYLTESAVTGAPAGDRDGDEAPQSPGSAAASGGGPS